MKEKKEFILNYIRILFKNTICIIDGIKNYDIEYLELHTIKSIRILKSMYPEVKIWLFKIETTPEEKNKFFSLLISFVGDLHEILNILTYEKATDKNNNYTIDLCEEDLKYLQENNIKIFDVINSL